MRIECPHCNQEIEVEVPQTVRRGALAGLSLEEMSDEQLKKEIVNAKSVLYKAEKRGADAAIIAKNKDRVDAAVAEKAKRDALKKGEEVTAEVAESNETSEEGNDSVYESDEM